MLHNGKYVVFQNQNGPLHFHAVPASNGGILQEKETHEKEKG